MLKVYKTIIITIFTMFATNAVEQTPESFVGDISYTQQTDSTETVKVDSVQLRKNRIHEKNLKLQTKLSTNKIGNFKDFLDKLAWRESRGNWKVVNRFGYVGKYQMGGASLTELHYELDVDTFRVHPEIFPEEVQDSLVVELVKLNRKRIKPYIVKYNGKMIHGIKVTESGILGASHLVGGGNVRKWLKTDGECCPEDGNGVSIEEYLVLFSKFNINS